MSYVTELRDSRLGSAYRADCYTRSGDPCKIEESADALEEVAYEKGTEVSRHLGVNK